MANRHERLTAELDEVRKLSYELACLVGTDFHRPVVTTLPYLGDKQVQEAERLVAAISVALMKYKTLL